MANTGLWPLKPKGIFWANAWKPLTNDKWEFLIQSPAKPKIDLTPVKPITVVDDKWEFLIQSPKAPVLPYEFQKKEPKIAVPQIQQGESTASKLLNRTVSADKAGTISSVAPVGKILNSADMESLSYAERKQVGEAVGDKDLAKKFSPYKDESYVIRDETWIRLNVRKTLDSAGVFFDDAFTRVTWQKWKSIINDLEAKKELSAKGGETEAKKNKLASMGSVLSITKSISDWTIDETTNTTELVKQKTPLLDTELKLVVWGAEMSVWDIVSRFKKAWPLDRQAIYSDILSSYNKTLEEVYKEETIENNIGTYAISAENKKDAWRSWLQSLYGNLWLNDWVKTEDEIQKERAVASVMRQYQDKMLWDLSDVATEAEWVNMDKDNVILWWQPYMTNTLRLMKDRLLNMDIEELKKIVEPEEWEEFWQDLLKKLWSDKQIRSSLFDYDDYVSSILRASSSNRVGIAESRGGIMGKLDGTYQKAVDWAYQYSTDSSLAVRNVANWVVWSQRANSILLDGRASFGMSAEDYMLNKTSQFMWEMWWDPRAWATALWTLVTFWWWAAPMVSKARWLVSWAKKWVEAYTKAQKFSNFLTTNKWVSNLINFSNKVSSVVSDSRVLSAAKRTAINWMREMITEAPVNIALDSIGGWQDAYFSIWPWLDFWIWWVWGLLKSTDNATKLINSFSSWSKEERRANIKKIWPAISVEEIDNMDVDGFRNIVDKTRNSSSWGSWTWFSVWVVLNKIKEVGVKEESVRDLIAGLRRVVKESENTDLVFETQNIIKRLTPISNVLNKIDWLRKAWFSDTSEEIVKQKAKIWEKYLWFLSGYNSDYIEKVIGKWDRLDKKLEYMNNVKKAIIADAQKRWITLWDDVAEEFASALLFPKGNRIWHMNAITKLIGGKYWKTNKADSAINYIKEMLAKSPETEATFDDVIAITRDGEVLDSWTPATISWKWDVSIEEADIFLDMIMWARVDPLSDFYLGKAYLDIDNTNHKWLLSLVGNAVYDNILSKAAFLSKQLSWYKTIKWVKKQISNFVSVAQNSIRTGSKYISNKVALSAVKTSGDLDAMKSWLVNVFWDDSAIWQYMYMVKANYIKSEKDWNFSMFLVDAVNDYVITHSKTSPKEIYKTISDIPWLSTEAKMLVRDTISATIATRNLLAQILQKSSTVSDKAMDTANAFFQIKTLKDTQRSIMKTKKSMITGELEEIFPIADIIKKSKEPPVDNTKLPDTDIYDSIVEWFVNPEKYANISSSNADEALLVINWDGTDNMKPISDVFKDVIKSLKWDTKLSLHSIFFSKTWRNILFNIVSDSIKDESIRKIFSKKYKEAYSGYVRKQETSLSLFLTYFSKDWYIDTNIRIWDKTLWLNQMLSWVWSSYTSKAIVENPMLWLLRYIEKDERNMSFISKYLDELLFSDDITGTAKKLMEMSQWWENVYLSSYKIIKDRVRLALENKGWIENIDDVVADMINPLLYSANQYVNSLPDADFTVDSLADILIDGLAKQGSKNSAFSSVLKDINTYTWPGISFKNGYLYKNMDYADSVIVMDKLISSLPEWSKLYISNSDTAAYSYKFFENALQNVGITKEHNATNTSIAVLESFWDILWKDYSDSILSFIKAETNEEKVRILKSVRGSSNDELFLWVIDYLIGKSSDTNAIFRKTQELLLDRFIKNLTSAGRKTDQEALDAFAKVWWEKRMRELDFDIRGKRLEIDNIVDEKNAAIEWQKKIIEDWITQAEEIFASKEYADLQKSIKSEKASILKAEAKLKVEQKKLNTNKKKAQKYLDEWLWKTKQSTFDKLVDRIKKSEDIIAWLDWELAESNKAINEFEEATTQLTKSIENDVVKADAEIKRLESDDFGVPKLQEELAKMEKKYEKISDLYSKTIPEKDKEYARELSEAYEKLQRNYGTMIENIFNSVVDGLIKMDEVGGSVSWDKLFSAMKKRVEKMKKKHSELLEKIDFEMDYSADKIESIKFFDFVRSVFEGKTNLVNYHVAEKKWRMRVIFDEANRMSIENAWMNDYLYKVNRDGTASLVRKEYLNSIRRRFLSLNAQWAIVSRDTELLKSFQLAVEWEANAYINLVEWAKWKHIHKFKEEVVTKYIEIIKWGKEKMTTNDTATVMKYLIENRDTVFTSKLENSDVFAGLTKKQQELTRFMSNDVLPHLNTYRERNWLWSIKGIGLAFFLWDNADVGRTNWLFDKSYDSLRYINSLFGHAMFMPVQDVKRLWDKYSWMKTFNRDMLLNWTNDSQLVTEAINLYWSVKDKTLSKASKVSNDMLTLLSFFPTKGVGSFSQQVLQQRIANESIRKSKPIDDNILSNIVDMLANINFGSNNKNRWSWDSYSDLIQKYNYIVLPDKLLERETQKAIVTQAIYMLTNSWWEEYAKYFVKEADKMSNLMQKVWIKSPIQFWTKSARNKLDEFINITLDEILLAEDSTNILTDAEKLDIANKRVEIEELKGSFDSIQKFATKEFAEFKWFLSAQMAATLVSSTVSSLSWIPIINNTDLTRSFPRFAFGLQKRALSTFGRYGTRVLDELYQYGKGDLKTWMIGAAQKLIANEPSSIRSFVSEMAMMTWLTLRTYYHANRVSSEEVDFSEMLTMVMQPISAAMMLFWFIGDSITKWIDSYKTTADAWNFLSWDWLSATLGFVKDISNGIAWKLFLVHYLWLKSSIEAVQTYRATKSLDDALHVMYSDIILWGLKKAMTIKSSWQNYINDSVDAGTFAMKIFTNAQTKKEKEIYRNSTLALAISWKPQYGENWFAEYLQELASPDWWFFGLLAGTFSDPKRLANPELMQKKLDSLSENYNKIVGNFTKEEDFYEWIMFFDRNMMQKDLENSEKSLYKKDLLLMTDEEYNNYVYSQKWGKLSSPLYDIVFWVMDPAKTSPYNGINSLVLEKTDDSDLKVEYDNLRSTLSEKTSVSESWETFDRFVMNVQRVGSNHTLWNITKEFVKYRDEDYSELIKKNYWINNQEWLNFKEWVGAVPEWWKQYTQDRLALQYEILHKTQKYRREEFEITNSIKQKYIESHPDAPSYAAWISTAKSNVWIRSVMSELNRHNMENWFNNMWWDVLWFSTLKVLNSITRLRSDWKTDWAIKAARGYMSILWNIVQSVEASSQSNYDQVLAKTSIANSFSTILPDLAKLWLDDEINKYLWWIDTLIDKNTGKKVDDGIIKNVIDWLTNSSPSSAISAFEESTGKTITKSNWVSGWNWSWRWKWTTLKSITANTIKIIQPKLDKLNQLSAIATAIYDLPNKYEYKIVPKPKWRGFSIKASPIKKEIRGWSDWQGGANRRDIAPRWWSWPKVVVSVGRAISKWARKWGKITKIRPR